MRSLVGSTALVALGAWAVLQPPYNLYSLWDVALAGAGLLFMGRSATSQAIARGAAWSVIVPNVVVTMLALSHRFLPGAYMVVPTAIAAAALVVTRPLLERDEAKRTFAPVAMRSWFLASATMAIGAGLAVAKLATALAGVHFKAAALVYGLLGLSLIASGIGVVRMRSWGILVGALSSMVALAAAAFLDVYFIKWPILAAALPGAMMTLGILSARARVQNGGAPIEPARVRVVGDEEEEQEEEEEEAAQEEAPASRRLAMMTPR